MHTITRPLALYLMLFFALAAAAPACSGNARMKTINTTVLALDTARSAFHVWTRDHQKSIIAGAVKDGVNREEALERLAAYIEKRDKVTEGLEIAYDALKLAATKEDEATLQDAMAAFRDLVARIQHLTGGL